MAPRPPRVLEPGSAVKEVAVSTRSHWKDHGHWQCQNHVPPINLPASATRCWMVGCSVRPPEDLRPEEVAVVDPGPMRGTVVSIGESPCAYEGCSNVARDGSKYCSRACSNRNARKRHKERKVA